MNSRKPVREVFVGVAALMAACQHTPRAQAAPQEGKTMQASDLRPTIEHLAQRIALGKSTLADIAHALGGRPTQGQKEIDLLLDVPPFQAVHIREFRGSVNLVINTTPGQWTFKEIVAEPDSWALAPALPDTGAVEAVRTWHLPTLSVTCIVRVRGDGPLPDRAVTGQLRCQVSPG